MVAPPRVRSVPRGTGVRQGPRRLAEAPKKGLFGALRGFRVFGRTLRHNQNLAIAAGPDAHRGQCAFIPQRHMDDSAISGIHRIKGHGAAQGMTEARGWSSTLKRPSPPP